MPFVEVPPGRHGDEPKEKSLEQSAADAARTSAGHQIYYRLFPEDLAIDAEPDRPRVLLVMGVGATHIHWKFQIDHLSKFCRVCAMDNRGAGFSTAPARERRWTTSGMARDAGVLLDSLGWRDGVHVVGMSMGGMIAQELALANPDRIASLCLLATTASVWYAIPTIKALREFALSLGLSTSDWREQGRASMRLNFPEAWLRQTSASSLHDGREVENARWVSKFFVLLGKDLPEELRAAGKRGRTDIVSRRTMFMQAVGIQTHRVTVARCEPIRRRGVPVTVMTGDEDILVRPVNSTLLARFFDTHVDILKGCGHGLNFQDPEGVNNLISEAIRKGEQRLTWLRTGTGDPPAASTSQPASRL